MDRVIIQWTDTAKDRLAKCPRKVRRGLLDKAAELRDSDRPRAILKPLKGPLCGLYRICFGRYRAIYGVEDESLANGDTLIHIKFSFIAVGITTESDKQDMVRLAKKLIDLGLIDGVGPDQIADSEAD